MSKTNFTAQTETIDTNYDMLNYFYYKQAFNSDEIKKIVLICEKLDSEIIKHNDSEISSDDKRRDTISYLPLNDETSWIYDKIYNLSIEANQDMGWNLILIVLMNIWNIVHILIIVDIICGILT